MAPRSPSTAPAGAARPKFIPIDAPTDVDGETLQAFLRAGDLFGEMSCLNRSPRSATIIAARDCYVLEMLRNIFEKVKEDANYKKKVEEEYKARMLEQQLTNIPLFSGLTDAQRAEIAEAKKQYEARVAQRRIMHQTAVASTFDPVAALEREEELRRDLARFEREHEETLARIRRGDA